MDNTEIELKFEIRKNQISYYTQMLLDHGFQQNERVYEISVMYDNPQELMQITDGRVRLRKSGTQTIFTYKKPLSRKGIKRELEYEVTVSDFVIMENILKMMQFTKTTSYERYRTLFYNKKHLKVMIDEFPYATFLEIEGTEKQITDLASTLKFSLNNNLTDSCDTIYTKRCIEKGLNPLQHILFKNCNISSS